MEMSELVIKCLRYQLFFSFLLRSDNPSSHLQLM